MQWNSSPARDQFTTSVQQVLADQVADLEDEQEDAPRAAGSCRGPGARVPAAVDTTSSALAELNRRLAEARLEAGLTAVRGPGVT